MDRLKQQRDYLLTGKSLIKILLLTYLLVYLILMGLYFMVRHPLSVLHRVIEKYWNKYKFY
uniref:Uncharacterized protein n=1 Tax=virus sp. ctPYc18 TaxID=2828251 RepID=A0A8S5RD76_9VIRU|nr:MAG TPA: hypothetical protein [virus sp. ctPYc18]